jgi:hypothetical protein
MRFVGAALLLTLATVSASAEDSKPADSRPTTKVPLRVVRMLPDANQALLFDKTHGNYVAVGAGQAVDGFTVNAIEDDEVTLMSDSGAVVVLAAPAHRRRADTGSDDETQPVAKPVVAKAAPAPADPYGPEPQPADPYADMTAPSAGNDVRVVEAPSTATATPMVSPTPVGTPTVVTPTPVGTPTVVAPTVTPTPVVTASPTPPPAKVADEAAALAAVMTGSPAPAIPATVTATVPAGPTVIAHADVSAALANFGALAGAIHGGFTADGLHIDAVAPGSLFAKAGLRAGDVIASVDGKPLRSLDDAANLYARASTARTLTAQIVRSGSPVTLRVAIQ